MALREGTFSAKELRPLEYGVDTLRLAGFAAKELVAVAYTLAELKEGGYSGAECRVAGFGATDMRGAGFTASEMRAAGAWLTLLVAAVLAAACWLMLPCWVAASAHGADPGETPAWARDAC